MSTKIFTGFRLADISMLELMKKIEEFRPVAMQLARAKFENYLSYFDCNENGVPTAKDGRSAYAHWMDSRRDSKQTGYRCPATDTDFTLRFLPVEGYGILGVVSCSSLDWYRRWLEVEGVEEFSYWNNVDEPEGMSEEDWAYRKKAWEALGYDPLAEQMLSIDLIPEIGPLLNN